MADLMFTMDMSTLTEDCQQLEDTFLSSPAADLDNASAGGAYLQHPSYIVNSADANQTAVFYESSTPPPMIVTTVVPEHILYPTDAAQEPMLQPMETGEPFLQNNLGNMQLTQQLFDAQPVTASTTELTILVIHPGILNSSSAINITLIIPLSVFRSSARNKLRRVFSIEET